MARFVFYLPDLGEGLADAKVVEWHVAVGDEVERNAVIAEVETEKASVELPAPVSGVVAELHAAVGDLVDVGAELVSFDVADEPGIVGTVPHERQRTRRVHLTPPAD
jgi:pyruvate/2-oxoglutarate dehydrogenase complex dihydrolipoamide acyltransferase (E2) component